MLRKEYTIYILYVFKSKLNLRNTLRKKSYKKLWHFFLSVRKNDVYFYTEAEIINLSRSWNLSVGSNKVEIVLQFSRFKGVQLKPVFVGFETRLKFIKFGHRLLYYFEIFWFQNVFVSNWRTNFSWNFIKLKWMMYKFTINGFMFRILTSLRTQICPGCSRRLPALGRKLQF